MPTVEKIIGVKATGVKNNKPWQITTVRVDSGQMAETFDMIAVGDSGTLAYDDKYNSYKFKKDKAGASVSGSSKETHRNQSADESLNAPNQQQPATKYQPKDEAAIKAMWAIKAAIAYRAGDDLELLEVTADKLFAMVDRVKKGGKAIEAVELPPVEAYDEIPEEILDDL